MARILKREISKSQLKLARRLVHSVAVSALKAGIVNLDGKTDEEAARELQRHLESVAKQRSFSFTVDHTTSLLREARRFSTERREEFALVFYAMWFEHWVNHMIDCRTLAAGISRKEESELMRETSIRAKTSWVMTLLRYPRIAQRHRKIVIDVANTRNQFVHHKYLPVEDTDSDRVRALLTKAERSVRYLKRYEVRALGVRHHKVRTLLKLRHGENISQPKPGDG